MATQGASGCGKDLRKGLSTIRLTVAGSGWRAILLRDNSFRASSGSATVGVHVSVSVNQRAHRSAIWRQSGSRVK